MSLKKILTFLICLTLSLSSVGAFALDVDESTFGGKATVTSRVLYEGVTETHISFSEDSKYGQQEIWVVEFDPTREDLVVDVTGGGEYAVNLKTVKGTVEKFKEENGEGKVPIAAINGDLWMVSAHARVVGSGKSYGGCSDEVVKHSLTLPRGLNIYNGEIITSPHTSAETPFEGNFDCFGITADGRTILGTPTLKITCKDLTQGSGEVKITGLNRLPANKSIMLYSDKSAPDNAALDDAYELVIDCDHDYVVKQDSVIKGKVTAICKPGDEDPKMKPNRFIMTARGAKYISQIENINIGDELEFTFTLSGSKKDNDIWQEVVTAVGGHMILVRNGKAQAVGDGNKYPTSIIGNTKDGRILFTTMDGRQPGYTAGMKISDMPGFLVQLGYENCFLLDGGGSATMVNINDEGGYDLINHPCDTYSDGSYGAARSVVNSIILSVVKKVEPTEEPTAEATPAPDETVTTEPKPEKKGCGTSVSGTLALAIVSSTAMLLLVKRKKTRIK